MFSSVAATLLCASFVPTSFVSPLLNFIEFLTMVINMILSEQRDLLRV